MKGNAGTWNNMKGTDGNKKKLLEILGNQEKLKGNEGCARPSKG